MLAHLDLPASPSPISFLKTQQFSPNNLKHHIYHSLTFKKLFNRGRYNTDRCHLQFRKAVKRYLSPFFRFATTQPGTINL